MRPKVTDKVAIPEQSSPTCSLSLVEEQRNEHLAQTIIKNLQRRHIEGFYCTTGKEAVKKVLELIPDGRSVTWGGTMTVRDLGIPDALRGLLFQGQEEQHRPRVPARHRTGGVSIHKRKRAMSG